VSDDDLALAQELADTADAITTDRFLAADLHVQAKPDRTPVTDADRSVEEAVRRRLSAERPDDAVVGEEFGESGGGPRRWVLDPVDGTKNFLRGVPMWATLLALEIAGQLTVAVVSAPALGRRWWATKGGGAHVRALGVERACRVSGVDRLSDAYVSYSSLHSWREIGLMDGFLRLTHAAWRTRGLGDFYSYMLVAEGAVDVALEPDVEVWDLAAPALIVHEAGGRFTDLAGNEGPTGGSGVATNRRLHGQVLSALHSPG
jgi:histidinol-phosphatase